MHLFNTIPIIFLHFICIYHIYHIYNSDPIFESDNNTRKTIYIYILISGLQRDKGKKEVSCNLQPIIVKKNSLFYAIIPIVSVYTHEPYLYACMHASLMRKTVIVKQVKRSYGRDRQIEGKRMRQEKSSPNKPGLTNQIFLHTAVELAELSNVVKR